MRIIEDWKKFLDYGLDNLGALQKMSFQEASLNIFLFKRFEAGILQFGFGDKYS